MRSLSRGLSRVSMEGAFHCVLVWRVLCAVAKLGQCRNLHLPLITRNAISEAVRRSVSKKSTGTWARDLYMWQATIGHKIYLHILGSDHLKFQCHASQSTNALRNWRHLRQVAHCTQPQSLSKFRLQPCQVLEVNASRPTVWRYGVMGTMTWTLRPTIGRRSGRLSKRTLGLILAHLYRAARNQFHLVLLFISLLELYLRCALPNS